MSAFETLLCESQKKISETDPREVTQLIQEKANLALLDVRGEEELLDGIIPNALHIPRSFLELKIEKLIPDKEMPIVCYCASGIRSVFAAETLQRMGYTSVNSLSGGTQRWLQEGYSLEIPLHVSKAEKRRYKRHLLLPEVGIKGQLAFSKARVLLVGAGGLGSPVAYYLAAAGIGNIGIIDHDLVDESNLQRQILYSTNDVGRQKVEVAKEKLSTLNNLIEVKTYPVRLTKENALQIMEQYDIIVDGSDNFPTRYLINDTCIQLKKPNVHGSIYRFEGQVATFWPGKGPCYRCLYQEAPPKELAPNCAEAGVLGVLPGTIGLLQATEVLKLILHTGEALVGKMLLYDALKGEFRKLNLQKNPQCYC